MGWEITAELCPVADSGKQNTLFCWRQILPWRFYSQKFLGGKKENFEEFNCEEEQGMMNNSEYYD